MYLKKYDIDEMCWTNNLATKKKTREIIISA